MTTFVLTVIGDDRAGLVKALADVVSENGGNWERGQLAELAGKFAGIVVVTVPPERAPALRQALTPLEGLLEVSVHAGDDDAAHDPAESRRVRLEILGNDHPGIVRAISGVLAEHGLTVTDLQTWTREAPMAGGMLFEAEAVVLVPPSADIQAVQADLERLASEIVVGVTLAPA